MTFLLATPILIVLIFALIIAISISVEIEREGWATTFFSVSIALLCWHFWSDIWGWISSNPIDTSLFIGGYIVGGITWAIIKWKSYISASARDFKGIKDRFISKHKEIGSNWALWIDTLNREWKRTRTGFYAHDEPEEIVKKVTIDANDKKPLIVSWIAYWPMSIAATLLNDPIRRLISFVYDRISGIFQRMSNSSTKDFATGMDKYEETDQKKR
jgi:hypothetical protein